MQVSSGGVMGYPFARARVCQRTHARMARGRGCRHHPGRGGRTCGRGGRGADTTWSWIGISQHPQVVPQASQISQAVPQLDVARPFAPQLPQVVPQVQAQARRGA